MGSLSKTPGDSNQKIMGSFRFGIALLVLTSVATAKDVFRYVDEETGQSHYMTGDPGSSVEGGWTFTNSDGTFELAYKADEAGFQPEADHIPISVEDTNEVTGAKNTFYTLYDEHKAKVEAGFVPKAAYIPDTNEVVEAKKIFYSLVEEHKAKVEAAKAEAVVDTRRKRSSDDVFRYEDEATGQTHYMTGEPGMTVEGGWTFTNPEGSYELVYKADEGGFQPEAAHIPVSVEDTNEVAEAKAAFYSLYDEHKAKVSGRKKRDVMDMSMEKSQDLTLPPPPHPYNFHPFLGLGGVKPEDSENELYKYVPYYGFVPAEEKADEEDPEAEDEDVKTYKFNPFYGFVEKTDEDNEETAEEMSERQYKFVPFYGFVPVNEDGEVEETAKNYGNLKYTFHPYYGFLPTPTDGEVEQQLYKLDPVVGFYPSEKEDTEETELDAKRKKRDAQFLVNPVYHPVQQVVYVPVIPTKTGVQTGKTAEKTPEIVPNAVVPLYPGSTGPIVAPAFFGNQFLFRYPLNNPVAALPENQYPVIPHDPQDAEQGPVEF